MVFFKENNTFFMNILVLLQKITTFVFPFRMIFVWGEQDCFSASDRM